MDEKNQQISRRSFLKGAAAGIAALAAPAVLNNVTASAADKDVQPEVMDTEAIWHGGEYKVDMKNVEPIPVVEEPAKYDYETDLLIIGYGLGGTSAALTASNMGKKVLVLEKSLRHNWSEHAGVHTIGMTGVKEWLDFHGYGEWNDELIDATLDAIFPLGMSVADREASHINMKAGVEAFEQIRALPGCEFEMVEIFPEWRGYPTMIPCHTTDPYIENGDVYTPWQNKYHAVEHRIHDRVVENGGEVLWGTPATNLIMKDGAVVGARAVDPDGNVIHVKAKAVLDCVGGIGSNYDMIKYYSTFDGMLGCHVGPITNDGSGMRMCQGAGAGVRGLPRQGAFAEGGFDCFALNLPWNMPHDNKVTRAAGLGDKMFSVYTYAPIQLGRQPVLKTNKYGFRFEDENVTWDAKVWQAFQQPNHRYYTFFDSNIEQVVEKLNERYGMCERFITPDLQIYFDDGDVRNLYDWKEEFQDGIEKGLIVKADTIEELADKLGVNKENLVKTVEHYNEMCKNGVDTDYGKDPQFLYPIEKAPFYGCERMPGYLWMADGGIACDPYGRAMNERAEIIPGLYCGANDAKVTDHQTYTNKQQKPTCGGADFAITMGYLAGKAAVEDMG